MKRNILVILLAMVSSGVYGQKDTLSAEQEKLSFIRGKWTVDGSEAVYIETCEWIQGNHLQCSAESKENRKDNSISYFTYSKPEDTYIYHGFYGSGGSRILRGKWLNDHFEFEGQRQLPDKLIRWRVTMKPNNGKIDFREERSVNNGAWEETVKFQYKPAM